LPGSELFGLQSRTHLLLGQRKEALEVALEGMRAAGGEFEQSAADLALLAAFILEGDKRYGEALPWVVIGAQFSEDIGHIPFSLLGNVRELRLNRRLGVDVPSAWDSVQTLARTIGPNQLASDPSMLREIAAELGASDVELLRWACGVLLEELLLPMSNPDLIALLIGCGLASDSEKLWMTNIDPIELQKMAR